MKHLFELFGTGTKNTSWKFYIAAEILATNDSETLFNKSVHQVVTLKRKVSTVIPLLFSI